MQGVIKLSSSKRLEMIDITRQVEDIVKKSKVKDGMCNVFTSHATAAIAINENHDPNICDDFNHALSLLIPQGKWLHDNVDANGDSHIKSAIVGPSETIPIKDGRLVLGTWQALCLCEFDGPRNDRNVIVTITGE